MPDRNLLHRRKITFNQPRLALAAVVLLIGGGVGGVLAADAVPAEAARTQELAASMPSTLSEVSQYAWKLGFERHKQQSQVEKAELDALWLRIQQLSQKGQADPELAALSRDIDLLRAHEQEQREKTRTQYEELVTKLREQIERDDLLEALASAVRANSLVEEVGGDVLHDEHVKRIVQMSEAKAAEYEAQGQWLKALSLYRGLELLFENEKRYDEPFKRVARRVSLLRLYAPDVLFDLYKKEAEERGEDPPDPFNFEEDHWQTQLEGIQPIMLFEALSLARSQHVEGGSFEELLIGGIDGLRILFDTPGVEKTFPALKDAEKVRQFNQRLDEERVALVQRTETNAMKMDYAATAKVLERILDRNRTTIALPESVIVHEFGMGAMSVLDDFSTFIWPTQKARFERTTSGKFTGVGIQITLVDRELTVVTPLEDTPAHRAGIKPGERIVTIDGKSTIGIDLETAVERITGPENTTVTLGIRGPGDEKARNIELVRSVINILSIKGWQRKAGGEWDFYVDPQRKIGYIRMTTFGPNTAEEMDSAVHSMMNGKGLNGLIFDLRHNPGGLLPTAVAVSNRFLDEGVIVSARPNQALVPFVSPYREVADKNHTYPEFPVVILINRGSASASEIVSGALKDWHRALIVGERTFGKGSVQNLFRIGNQQAYLKLTTQYYRLPDGEIIHRRPGAESWGIDPHVPVTMTDQQVADLIQARMFLDILVGENEQVNRESLTSRKKDDEKDEAAVEAALRNQKLAESVKSADDILALGLDPQLETALLLLRARLLDQTGG